MQNNIIQKCREKLYSAVIADTMDSMGFHKQVLQPGIFFTRSKYQTLRVSACWSLYANFS